MVETNSENQGMTHFLLHLFEFTKKMKYYNNTLKATLPHYVFFSIKEFTKETPL